MKTNKYYVTMTDSFMSGWGYAKNKINKLVFPLNVDGSFDYQPTHIEDICDEFILKLSLKDKKIFNNIKEGSK